jgi:hypothetical protein
LRAAPLGVAGVAFARVAPAAESCVAPESESLRASLNYTAATDVPAAACRHCAFFTADPAVPACGACTLLGGPVDATGSCDSFSPSA